MTGRSTDYTQAIAALYASFRQRWGRSFVDVDNLEPLPPSIFVADFFDVRFDYTVYRRLTIEENGGRQRDRRAWSANRSATAVVLKRYVAFQKLPISVMITIEFSRNFRRKCNKINTIWRKRWDSNPRYGFPHAGFQDRFLKPLGHSSCHNGTGPYEKWLARFTAIRGEASTGLPRIC